MILQQQNIIDKRTRPKFEQGRLIYTEDYSDSVNGENTQFVTSEPIIGGQHFYLRVKSGYKVAFVAFFDSASRKRPLIRGWYNHNGATLEGVDGVVNRDTLTHKTKSTTIRSWIPAGAYARVTICKADVEIHDGETTGTDILPSDDFLDVFYTFDHVFMQPSRTTAAPATHAVGMKLARQVSNCFTRSRVATINQDSNQGWYGTTAENSICMGIFYSAVSAQRPGSMNMLKPSMETYLSLWHNRRSLLYTERPMDGVSGYGIVWEHNTTPVLSYGRYPVGMVCNTAAATVFGVPEDVDETLWLNTTLFTSVYDSMSALLSDNAAKLRSFDVLYTAGNHVAVITNVFKVGSDTFIELFESSTDCQLRLLTPQTFYEHYTANSSRSYHVVRPKKAFYELVGRMEYRPTPGAPVTPRERSVYVPNDDICTFAGDKATIASGDPLWLNVRQTNGSTTATFDSIRIYQLQDDTYTLLQTLSMSQPASAHRKSFPGGDVVWDIEVTSLFSDGTLTGLFEATAYNSVSGAESEPTRFEVLNIGIANAYRIGLTVSGNSTYDLLAFLADGAQRDGREAFIRTLDSNYRRQTNTYCTYAHHMVHRHEEGKYGVLLADTMMTIASDNYCQLAVKGEYGYAFVNKPLSTLSNLLSSATVKSSKCLSINGNLASKSGWRTLVKAVGSSHVGKTYTIIFNDRVTHANYNMVVAQYSAASADDIASSNCIKSHVIHRLNDGITRETRMVDVKIEDDCTYLAVSCPLDAGGSAVIRDMVLLPVDLVRSEDEGFDYYFGWVGNPTEKSMLQDMTAASLLAYAKGYNRDTTEKFEKTVTADDVAERSDRNLFFLMWRDSCPPIYGRLISGGMPINWDASSFEGSGSSGSDWNTDGNKQVTIGGIVYRVASFFGDLDLGDSIEINF